MNRSLILACVFLLILSCRRNVRPVGPDGAVLGSITWLNLSPDLTNQLQSAASLSQYSNVLIDRTDTGYVNFASDPGVPWFYNRSNLLFPRADEVNANSPEPWLQYLLIPQGNHQLILTDTGHHPIDTMSVAITPDIPVSVWYMDSLGKYRGIAAPDKFVNQAGQAGVRLVDASPDAGTVFFTVNKSLVTGSGFPDSLKYGTITSFIPRAVAVQDTLRFRFYSVKDSVNVLARQTLIIQPGRSYTVAFTGYMNSQYYQNPKTRRWMSVSASPNVLLLKNN